MGAAPDPEGLIGSERAGRFPHWELSQRIINAAIEVHRVLGPGLLESLYLAALRMELNDQGIDSLAQVVVPAHYKGRALGADLRLDLLVGRQIVVEVKSVEQLLGVHAAQLLSYLRLTNLQVGLLINFNVTRLRSGLRRVVNLPLEPR